MSTGTFGRPHDRKETLKTGKEVVVLRNQFGLPRHKVKKRECLHCGKLFKSYAINNRLCEHCKKRT